MDLRLRALRRDLDPIVRAGSVIIAVPSMIDSGMMSWSSGSARAPSMTSASSAAVELPVLYGSSVSVRAASLVSRHSASPGMRRSAGRSKNLVYRATADSMLTLGGVDH